jgi:hypothetical protein
MASKKKIQITSISCYNTSENGHDELYLLCQPDGGFDVRYPSKLGSSESVKKDIRWNLKDFYLEFENEVLVTLWDMDLTFDPALATYLVSYDYTRDNLSKSQSVGIKNPNGAEYKIDIKIIA